MMSKYVHCTKTIYGRNNIVAQKYPELSCSHLIGNTAHNPDQLFKLSAFLSITIHFDETKIKNILENGRKTSAPKTEWKTIKHRLRVSRRSSTWMNSEWGSLNDEWTSNLPDFGLQRQVKTLDLCLWADVLQFSRLISAYEFRLSTADSTRLWMSPMASQSRITAPVTLRN